MKGNKILLITPEFRSYGEAIANKYRELGFHVLHIIDCPNFSIFKKAIMYHSIRTKLRILFRLIEEINCYLIYKRIKCLPFDYVVIIKGNHLTKRFLRKIKMLYFEARFINYQWDSRRAYQFTLKKDFLKNSIFFDKIYSFDMVDCKNNKELSYLPLFYLEDYQNLKESKAEPEIDCLFVGGLHSNRDNVLIKLYDQLVSNGLKCYFVLLNPRNVDIEHRPGIVSIIKPISHLDVKRLVERSRLIIDIHSKYQDGLTIRTFEALSAGKKLATTNSMILNEPFYDSTLIYVFNEDCPIIPNDFIFSKPNIIDMSSYSLTNFAINLIS